MKLKPFSIALALLISASLAFTQLRGGESLGQPQGDAAGEQREKEEKGQREGTRALRQQDPAPTVEQLQKYQKRLLDQRNDLLVLAGGLKTSSDFQPTTDLVNDLEGPWELLDCLSDLLHLESLMQCKADKLQVKTLINRRLKFSAGKFNLAIKSVNLDIVQIKSQAVLATAVKVRDDLRAIKDLLGGD